MHKLYVTHEKNENKRLIEAPVEIVVEELIKISAAGTVLAEIKEVFVFLDDAEDPVQPGHTVHPPNHRHIHCHRCHKIKVTVNYAGRLKEHSFSPNATLEKVEVWALDAFELKGADRKNKELHVQSASGPIPPLENKIGMYVGHDDQCATTVFLTPEMGYQG
jgi:hypothetical protein